MTGERYNPREVEPRWQAVWEANRIPDCGDEEIDSGPACRNLEFFARQPGGSYKSRLRTCTMLDVLARYNRARGCGVFHRTCNRPEMGFLQCFADNQALRGSDISENEFLDVMDAFGADTARWFMLSNSPHQREVEWTDAGMEGAHRFIQRLWRLVDVWSPYVSRADPPVDDRIGDMRIRNATHKALKAIGQDIERLAFNGAIARIHEFANVMALARPDTADEATCSATREGLDILVSCIAPMMPHLAEECWARLGHENLVSDERWPQYLETLIADDILVIPVQINGKKRASIEVHPNANKEEIEAASLAADVVQKYLNGSQPRKLIVVPKRIVNVVI